MALQFNPMSIRHPNLLRALQYPRAISGKVKHTLNFSLNSGINKQSSRCVYIGNFKTLKTKHMVKTIFYVAGGNVIHMSTKISDCTKILEVEGLLYEHDGNRLHWVYNEKHNGFTERIIMEHYDKIDSCGITRIIIYSVGS